MSSTVDLEAAGMNHGTMVTTITAVDVDSGSSDDGLSSLDGGEFDQAASAIVNSSVAAQLAAAGPVGVAAAAAITSGKKRKRPYSFEMNPSVRKRQQTRILRKLKATIDEYTRRVGQQAVVLLCTPGKPHNCYKVFGAKPLEDVIRSCKTVIMQELEHALAQQTPTALQEDPTLHELPPLVIDGIPTPVEKMSQAQLRAFIPLMLKYATGRGKPGWGKDSTRPPWWPDELPWANVRSDVRSDYEKHKISWTHALRQIVINCYRYYSRDDLLPTFTAAEGDAATVNDDDDHDEKGKLGQQETAVQLVSPNIVRDYSQSSPTVLKTIQHEDGSFSIVHVHPDGSIVTLAGVQTAQMQNTHAEATHAVQTLADVATQEHHTESGVQAVAMLREATINQDGQIILTGEDGQQAYPVSGLVTIPVSMYQTVVTNLSHVDQNRQTDDAQADMQVVMTQQQQQQQQGAPQLLAVQLTPTTIESNTDNS